MLLRQLKWIATAILALAAAGMPASAQYYMQFSTYSSWSVAEDGNTILIDESAIDQSTCYQHYNYALNLTVIAPDGRQVNTQNYGLYATTSIAYNSIAGNYVVDVAGTFYCGCAGANSQFFGSDASWISTAVTYTVTTTNWTDAGGYCSQISNCNPTCLNGPKCPVGKLKDGTGPGQACGIFHESLTPVLGNTCAPFAVSLPAGGPGPCDCK